MKRIALLLALSVTIATAVNAQIPDTVSIPLSNISIPTSPGFILLDESPAVIDHPASPKAFAASIYNAYTQEGGFPSSYGIEFTPFWFFRHPRMTSYKFLGYDKENGRQMIFSQLKKASLSMAYVNKPDTGSASAISNIAFGIRTTLISVRSQKNIQAIIEANDKVVENLRALNLKIIGLDPLEPGYNEKVQALIDNYENDKALLESTALLRQQIEVRPVFAVNAAFAYSTFFLDNTFANQHFGRLGVWAVMNYSQPFGKKALPENYFSLYTIFRYLQDGTVRDESGSWTRTSNLDFGAKAEVEISKLSLAVEYLFRQSDGMTESTFRAVGLLNYRLTKNFALTASFGRNFGDVQNLITLFGLNFGIDSGNEAATVKE